VPDPYRWLEQAGAPAVEQWVDAQNAYTDAVMSGFQGPDAIIKRAGQPALTSTQRFNPQIAANVLFYMRQLVVQRYYMGFVRFWRLISYGSKYRSCYEQDRNYLA